MTHQYIIHEQTGFVDMTCNLGCRHKAKTFRQLDIAVVETREVPDLWSAAYGQPGHSGTGIRAVDQFGVEWFRDWNGLKSDGYGGQHLWQTEDRRSAWQARADGTPSEAYDGFVIE